MSEHSSDVYTDAHRKVEPEEAFDIIAARVREERDKGNVPVIVYDLDATLFDNRSRVIKIIADLLMSEEGAKLPEDIRQKVLGIKPRNLRYRLEDTLRDVGIEDQEILDWFQKGWQKRFFTNEYVMFDLPTPGAVDFVTRLYKAGAKSLYVTGRDTPGMRMGTERSLSMFEFPPPRGEVGALITKPTFEMSDLDYKQNVIEEVKEHGPVVAVFDNEPKAMNIMARSFTGAEAIFLDTMHSPDAEPLDEGIMIMKNFRLPPQV